MQSTVRIAVSMFLLASALASAYHNGAKLRRDGVLNLYPFPRVGRASHRTWQVPINDFLIDYEPTEKRQMYAFPRVGRSDTSMLRDQLRADQFQAMPLRRTDSPGMWFGPRLGRAFKSQEDDITIQNENNERSDPELTLSDRMDRMKRQSTPL